MNATTSTLEDPKYLTDQLITYLGNKRSLLPFIETAVDKVHKKLDKEKLSTLDLFSGTGVVARFLKKHSSEIYVNDLESYSAIVNSCYLSNKSDVNFKDLEREFKNLTKQIQNKLAEGFITELYAPKDEANITTEDRVFYTRKNAIYLDTARQCLKHIPKEYRKYFLGPLLASASVHANTSGVFKGFYKNKEGIGQYGGTGQNALVRILGDIELELPVLSNFECPSTIYQADANVLVKKLQEVDLAYLDPPYNQHPYGSNYFMLSLLVDYKRPKVISEVSGIPVDWKRSSYNKRAEAENSLFDLISNCPAKFILISYNSEGFVSHESFLKRLKKYGKYDVCETQYNTFRGSRNLKDRATHVKEYLYLLEKN